MAQGATLLVLSLSVLVTVIAATGKSPVAVRTEKCSRNRVLPIPNGKLKRVAKGAVEFLVKCDKGFKASGGSEAGVVRCSTEGEIENVEDAPKCLMRKKKKNKSKGKENKVKELLMGDPKRREKMLRKEGKDVQVACSYM